ncbi:hypothetical protein B0T12DRAFT_400805 [Alternaria alternata]|nr:hypothetical protein B0T12DRAFT_400805 [Alternaria alternata]
MDDFRLVVLIFILLELCAVFSGTVESRRLKAKTRSQTGTSGTGSRREKAEKNFVDASLCIGVLTVFSMTIAACVLSTKGGHQRLFAAFMQSAVGILGMVGIVRTFQVLGLSCTFLTSVGWICSLMNLLPTFLPAILRYKGHVNNEGWEKYINATALCPVFLLYLVSVYLVSVYLSSGIDKRYLKRLVLQFCFPLVAEGLWNNVVVFPRRDSTIELKVFSIPAHLQGLLRWQPRPIAYLPNNFE